MMKNHIIDESSNTNEPSNTNESSNTNEIEKQTDSVGEQNDKEIDNVGGRHSSTETMIVRENDDEIADAGGQSSTETMITGTGAQSSAETTIVEGQLTTEATGIEPVETEELKDSSVRP